MKVVTRCAASYVAAVAVVSLVVPMTATARATDGAPGPDSSPAADVVSTSGWYTPDDATSITIYEPATGGVHPAVIFVHGGAWGRSQPNSYELGWAHDLARDEGWLVAVIGYPAKVPREHVVEPDAIARAIYALAHRPDVDRRAIALWGESAGGQLALLAAYRDATQLRPSVSAVVSISGPTDMTSEYFSLAQSALGAVTRFEGLSPRQARRAKSARYRATSPVHLVRAADPATFQAISRHDRLVPCAQVDRLTRLLAAAHVAHRTVRLPGKAHSTTLESQRPPGSRRTVQQLAVAFLAQVFADSRVAFGATS